MHTKFTRRSVLQAGASMLALGALAPAHAQSPTKLRFSSAFTEQDLRADGYKAFAAAIKDRYEFEPYWNNTLFKQGTELVALQRGNLEMCNLAPADISKQIPAWSLMTSAYLFRDVDHLRKTFKSDVGRDFVKMARDQLGIQVITPVYFGARHVNLKPDKPIRTPDDLRGIKLRMPPGEFWQFLGESIGVNPTPVAFAEVYTALQTGAIDGQDNPLLLSKLMKFDEVTTQFVLTGHVIGYDVMVVTAKIWDAMNPAATGAVPGRGGEGDRRLHDQVQRPGKGRRRVLQEGRAARSTRPTSTRSASTRRRNTSTSTARIGRRAHWTASTRCSRAMRHPFTRRPSQLTAGA